VQPRTDATPKVHTYSHAELFNHLNEVSNAIMLSKQPDLEPVEGNHCFWCPARRTKDMNLKCKAIKEKALLVAKEDFGTFLKDMNAPVTNLTDPNSKRDAAIIKIISLLPLMQQIAKDGTEEFLDRIARGENIPGLVISHKEGRREWANDEEYTISILKEAYPELEPIKTVTSLKTITEIEKIVGKNKMDKFTKKSLTKKLSIEDKKVQEVLGEMSAYGNLINNGEQGDIQGN
jgi:hypothetical protein